jgi:hypothetical protein
MSALIDLKNPLTEVPRFRDEVQPAVKKGNHDGVQVGNIEFTVPTKEQIHILGNKQDIEGFKEFVTQPSTSVEESIDTFEQMSLFDDSSFEEIETDTNNNSAGIEQLMLALYPQNRSNDVLTNFWDSKVETNNELKQKLKEQKIVSLDNFIKQRNSGIYKSDEDFLESLGCL